jgi:hypothetical protein
MQAERIVKVQECDPFVASLLRAAAQKLNSNTNAGYIKSPPRNDLKIH